MGEMFPLFRERVDRVEAARMAKKLCIDAEIVVGELTSDAWATCDDRKPLITMRREVPRYVVLHELAHANLAGKRVTDHGLRFIDAYQELVWAWFEDKHMSRTFEVALRRAR